MNAAIKIVEALADAGLGTIGQDIFVGRIPAEDSNNKWAVTVMGGSTPTHWKTITTLQVMVIVDKEDVATMYSYDPIVRKALTSIPFEDAFIPRVTVSPMQDNDLAESEQRVGAWSVEVVTINSKEE